jgi:hypothetical protein
MNKLGIQMKPLTDDLNQFNPKYTFGRMEAVLDGLFFINVFVII